mgnify:CR=1 FL=1
MSKYTYLENVAMCKMNDKGFIYRLIVMNDDIKDFFRMYEINEAVIQNLKTKASIIIAEDDPVVPFHTTKHLSDNSHVNFLSTKYGGHNGFVENFKLEDFSIKILEEEFSKNT